MTATTSTRATANVNGTMVTGTVESVSTSGLRMWVNDENTGMRVMVWTKELAR